MGFLFSLALYMMSTQTVYSIYSHIVVANGIEHAPKLIVYDTPVNNAYYNCMNGTIVVYRGLLLAVGNDKDEAALVLGHELAHFIYHHCSSRPDKEYAADRLGANLMEHAGYNRCKGAQFLRKLHSGSSNTHPASDSRYRALGCS